MNQNSTIDSIFKNQLQQMEQPGADENWQRLEKELLAQQKKKRRGGAWLLGLLLLLGGSAALVWGVQGNEKQDMAAADGTSEVQPVVGTAANRPATTGTKPSAVIANTPDAATIAPTGVNAPMGTANGNTISNNRKARQTIYLSGGDVATGEVADKKQVGFNKKGNQKININTPVTENLADAETANKTAVDNNITTTSAVQMEVVLALTDAPLKEEAETELTASHAEPVTDIQNDNDPTATIRKDKKTPLPKPQLELAAGVDVSNGYIGSGKYAIAMLRLSLNKKSNLLVGAGYASNAMSESYKQADKPNLLNQEVDAKVRGLSMLQFPILYEQAIKENKLLFRAGITPVYILNASIVNIPNSFGGNPGNFRTFTLSDINRLNVLFTAGLQMRLTQRLGIEFKAHYGLTELVKNSYINQSGENNNFKSTQVGLLFMIGKKR